MEPTSDVGPSEETAEYTVGATRASEEDLPTIVESLRHDIERVVPHVLKILRRDEDAYRKRVDSLTREAREVATWPLAVGVHAFLERMRRTDMSSELLSSIEVDLGALLQAHGFSTFGRPGESFDPDCHEATSASSDSDDVRAWVVDEVVVAGLKWLERVVQKAVVTVSAGEQHSTQREKFDSDDLRGRVGA
jgi:molecular chaperone GrpE (heat shock protein)